MGLAWLAYRIRDLDIHHLSNPVCVQLLESVASSATADACVVLAAT